MLKSFLKETVIILLLIIAIILLIGVLVYKYLPHATETPAKVQEYALNIGVQAELEKELSNIESEEIIKTYMIDAKDMERYERSKEYDKGKVNPFEEYSGDEQETSNTTNTSNTSNGSTNNNNTNSSSGRFLNTVGK